MNITYDQEADALYIQFQPEQSGHIKETIKIKEGILCDIDKSGKVFGLEILDCIQRAQPPSPLAQKFRQQAKARRCENDEERIDREHLPHPVVQHRAGEQAQNENENHVEQKKHEDRAFGPVPHRREDADEGETEDCFGRRDRRQKKRVVARQLARVGQSMEKINREIGVGPVTPAEPFVEKL